MRHNCPSGAEFKSAREIFLKGKTFFYDLFHLASRAASYEQLMKEKRRNSSKGTYYRKPSLDLAMVEQDLDSESDDEVEVCVAEMLNGKPYVCPALSSPNSNASRSSKTKNKNMAEIGKDYSFDITKTEEIFDHLLKDGQLKLPEGHDEDSETEMAKNTTGQKDAGEGSSQSKRGEVDHKELQFGILPGLAKEQALVW